MNENFRICCSLVISTCILIIHFSSHLIGQFCACGKTRTKTNNCTESPIKNTSLNSSVPRLRSKSHKDYKDPRTIKQNNIAKEMAMEHPTMCGHWKGKTICSMKGCIGASSTAEERWELPVSCSYSHLVCRT